ncbi:MAG: LLM class flavin-dependent oxidoreductase [Candidatus Hodarchaeales archaeon]|jgi:alkanesulfonate monooxygenase SsuD/methylene tetrahydromethanopterin reductase-like flavin-dependent oxidoreductase (luciferase family)
MKFSIFAPTFADSNEKGNPGFAPTYNNLNWKDTKEYTLKAEELGFHGLWVPDHLIMGKDSQIFDSLTVLTALGGITDKIRLGTVVVCSAFRYPAILSKMVSTIDHISNGRFSLGLGSGFHMREFEAFNYPPIERSKTRELIEILRLLWNSENSTGVDYEGDHYSLKNAVSNPIPIQSPLPIYVAGQSEETLWIVADLADGWITTGSIENLNQGLGRLNKILDGNGRKTSIQDYIWFGPTTIMNVNEFNKTDSRGLEGSGSEIIEQITTLADMGFTELIFAFPDFPSDSMMNKFVKEIKPSF